MSAFQCSAAHLCAVADAIAEAVALGLVDDHTSNALSAHCLWRLGGNRIDACYILAGINRKALDARYGLDPKAYVPFDPRRAGHKDKYQPSPHCLLQNWEALRCYLYQCNEGEIPETPAYKALEELEAALRRYCAAQFTTSEEYAIAANQLQWHLDD